MRCFKSDSSALKEGSFLQCIHSAASTVPWVTASEPRSPTVSRQDLFGLLVGNSTQSMPSGTKVVPFTPKELLVAKAIYWTVFPLCQYVVAMILADTFQYFTHRAFHVNKWLYSELPTGVCRLAPCGLTG